MARLRIYAATDEVPDRIPAGFERISLVQEEHGEAVYYQVEQSDGGFYLCDADSEKVDISAWTLLRVLADVPADDADAFFQAIEQTAKRTELPLADQVHILSTITNRDHTGRHFTERYSDFELSALESAGLIAIDRPVHEATGIPWGHEHWTLEVTRDGQHLVDQYPEYHDTNA